MRKIEELKKELGEMHYKAFMTMAIFLNWHPTTTEAVQSVYDDFIKRGAALSEFNPLELLKRTFGDCKKACESAFGEIEAAITMIEKKGGSCDKNT